MPEDKRNPKSDLDSGTARPSSIAITVAFALAALISTVAVLIALWPSFAKGYDLTDEGLYLVSADPPGDGYALAGFFGLYLEPLYAALGHSVAAYRFAGTVLLILVAGYAGWSLGRLFEFRLSLTSQPLRIGLTAVSVLGALNYYSLYLVTPSYNWLALVGLLVGFAGLFRLLARSQARPASIALSTFLVSLGTVLLTASRLAVGPVWWLLLMVTVMLASLIPLQQKLRVLFASVAWLLAFAVVHLAFIAGPAESARILSDTIRLAVTTPYPGAPASDLVRQSVTQFVTVLPANLKLYMVFGLIAVFLPLTAMFARNVPMATRIAACVSLLVLPLVALTRGAITGGTAGILSQSTLWIGELLVAAGTLAVIWVIEVVDRPDHADRDSQNPPEPEQAGAHPETDASVGAQTREQGAASELKTSGPNRYTGRFVLGMVALLLASAFMFGATSNNGAYTQIYACLVIMIYATVFCVIAITRIDQRIIIAGIGILGATAFTTSLVSLQSAQSQPYRTSPIAVSTSPTQVTWRGAVVDLDASTRSEFNRLANAAADAGFSHGTPLADMTGFTPGIGYLLGSLTPPSIILGWDDQQARDTLTMVDRVTWCEAWILTSNTQQSINPAVIGVVGMQFPRDYVSVTNQGPFTLHRPAAEAVTRCRAHP